MFLATALAACDSSEPGICPIGPETEVDGDIHVQITSPANGDTLRVGQSFRFRGEVEATGDVSVLGVRLANEDLGFLPNTALFERDLGYGAGTYVIDEKVVLNLPRRDLWESVGLGKEGNAVLPTTAAARDLRDALDELDGLLDS
ncbi:MAG: hypothetical protein IIC18_10255 [Bacteroidetes bacterium]|nr:hypothetical protein [Bacteroidota bacterium]